MSAPWLRGPGWTLQRRLWLIGVVTTLLAWAGGVALALTVARAAMEELHDRELAEVAVLLHGISGHELQELDAAESIVDRIQNVRADSDGALGNDYRYQVWSAGGRLLLANFGDARTPALTALAAPGHHWRQIDGERWRVYSHRSQVLDQEVQVAERATLRAPRLARLDALWLLLVVPSLVLALLPAWWLSRWLLRPLRELARDLATRSPARLEPLQVNEPPADMLPVLAVLNALFERLAEALRRETAFTALAAHELRTPLATLRVLAETARSARDETERAQALGEMVQSVDRCAHLQDQLLTLSRLDSRGAVDLDQEVDMAEVVVDSVADLLAQARARAVRLVSRLDGSAVRGHRFGVLTLVRNLVANAVHCVPEGGRVEVSTATEGNSVVLTVDDSGPGIPAAERDRVFERFERLHHEQAGGVGLGLSIVRSVALMHGALVTLSDSPLGGLRVVVEFRGRALQRETLPEAAGPEGR